LKLAWNVLSILLLLHVIAAAALVVWLRATDRLDVERARRIYNLMSVTITEEKARQEEEARLAEATREEIEQMRWVQQVSTGPRTMFDRLDEVQEREEIATVTADRVQREIRDLQKLLANTESLLAAERAEIERQRAALQAQLAAERERRESEDFQQAVKLYEQLRPKQTKQMFQELLADGRVDEVVEYLAAMQVRKAAAVLNEFKAPQEIQQGTMLIERLRQRGLDMGAAPQQKGTGGPTT